MSARKSFDDLFAEDGEDTEPVAPAPPPPAPARDLRSKDTENTRSTDVPESGTSEVREPERRRKRADAAPKGPKWAALERKETLLWPQQVSALTDLRRDLQRRKRSAGGGGERITENTLIRVAVAALLEHGDALTGVDESELRESLSSVLRNSRTSEVRES